MSTFKSVMGPKKILLIIVKNALLFSKDKNYKTFPIHILDTFPWMTRLVWDLEIIFMRQLLVIYSLVVMRRNLMWKKVFS